MGEANRRKNSVKSSAPAQPLINADEIREAYKVCYSESNLDEKWSFFYDETNNIRKLHVENGKFNISDIKIFALGGVAYEGEMKEFNIDHLRQITNVQPNAKEMAFEYIGKGEFPDILRSRKLETFLKWVNKNDLYVHYHVIDPIYWSIVDIVDSILADANVDYLSRNAHLIKDDLYKILRLDAHKLPELFFEFQYPNVQASERKRFVRNLNSIISNNLYILGQPNKSVLGEVMSRATKANALPFIENNLSHVLIDTFFEFYMQRICLFSKSNHVFDEEKQIVERFSNVSIISEGKALGNYRFVDSKEDSGVQISDVMMGLIGRLFTFIVKSDAKEISDLVNNANNDERRRLGIIRDLISRSHEKNILLLGNTLSMTDHSKLNTLLGFSKSG